MRDRHELVRMPGRNRLGVWPSLLGWTRRGAEGREGSIDGMGVAAAIGAMAVAGCVCGATVPHNREEAPCDCPDRDEIVWFDEHESGEREVPVLDPEERARIRRTVDALRDDDDAGNAVSARSHLSAQSRKVWPWLRVALLSDDRQQRQSAAAILRGDPGTPSEMLLRACVEALEDDDQVLLRANEDPAPIIDRVELLTIIHEAEFELRRELDWTYELVTESDEELAGLLRRARGIDFANCTDAMEWFLQDPRRIRAAAPLLRGQISSPDPQASFLSACLLARVAAGEHERTLVIPILVASLMDNDICQDALMAVQALVVIGREGTPLLRTYLHRLDLQGESLLRHVIAHVEGDEDEDARRLDQTSLTEMGFGFDPIDPHRDPSGMPRILPNIPSGLEWVPYRPTLQLLPVSAE